MNRIVLAVGLSALGLAGFAAQGAGAVQVGRSVAVAEREPAAEGNSEAQPSEADSEAQPSEAEIEERWQRLQAQSRAAAEARREAREAYEQGVRDAAVARAQYEADTARHQAEVERARAAEADFQRAQAEYQREREAYDRRTGNRRPTRGAEAPAGEQSAASGQTCEERSRRNRRRGRVIGGVIGAAAGIAAGADQRNPGRAAAIAAISVPVGALIGDAIARMLDCEEQQQAAAATESVVERAATAGVGVTETWTSETREGVSGSSTVTAFEQEAGGGECLTVTDIVIVDGEETRAPKQLCRRPPSTRFVRV